MNCNDALPAPVLESHVYLQVLGAGRHSSLPVQEPQAQRSYQSYDPEHSQRYQQNTERDPVQQGPIHHCSITRTVAVRSAMRPWLVIIRLVTV